MRSIIEDIQSVFRRFFDSRKENLLIISCEPQDSALLLKGLEALDDDPESLDIFLIFGHPFNDSGEYVREIPPTISQELAAVNDELAQRGEQVLPPPPEEIMNESQEPSIRLVGLMRYVES